MEQLKTAIVVGGGLAGLSTALYLQKAGIQVTVLERHSFLGGRTASWEEQGMKVETGLHRFLGFFTELPKLLRLADVNPDDILFWEDEIEIRLKNKKPATFGASVFKPLRTVKGVLGNLHVLSIWDKLRVAKLFAAGFKDYFFQPQKLDNISIEEYATRHGVSDKAIQNLVQPLSSGLFFLPPNEYSAFVFFGVFAPFLTRLHKTRIGAFRGGMTEVMADPIGRKIIQLGGRILCDAPVESLIIESGSVVGVEGRGAGYRADTVVLAASLASVQKIISISLKGHPWFGPLLKMKTMPSVTIQMELIEPATDKDRTTFAPETSLAAFAEQSRSTFRHVPGRLSIILTPPDEFILLPANQILERVLEEAESIGVNLRNKVTAYRVITEPSDFYRLSPGSEALKPTQQTPVKGLVLAGDYTKQKYLATMEGAVYSGRLAAKIIITSSRRSDNKRES